MLRSVIALVLAPSTALAVQSVMYALVTPSCSTQTRVWIHVSAAIALAVAAVLAVLARSDWQAHAAGLAEGPDSSRSDSRSVQRFVAVMACAVAAISCLVILSMWMGAWVLSPCSEQ